MPITTERTHFTQDVQGRYICNTYQEALESTLQTGRADGKLRPDARPFDILIAGGGTFGAALAQHLFHNDILRKHRILLLEAGSYVLPEHVQNLPFLAFAGMNPPAPSSIAELRAEGHFGADTPRNQVWGLPWHSALQFPGLAYCLGGRSLFWGGWSPQPLPSETPTSGPGRNHWPANVVADLNNRYFHEAGEQTGVTQRNDFIRGDLHAMLRKLLFNGISKEKIPGAVALSQLKFHLQDQDSEKADVKADELKLEAPLAVQSSQPRAGFFPFDKFSSMPLLIQASRQAQAEANNDDVNKRLMVVTNCHVKRLLTTGSRVTAVETSQGTIPLPANGAVIVALGTIESARLAKVSFEGWANSGLIGKNLMAHLRSNLDIRIPRSALPQALPEELQTSALFVRGKHTHGDGTVGHFHLQITAAALSAGGADSEAELFKKVPDMDGLEAFKAADDQSVVITIRGIGEMEAQNPNSFVKLDDSPTEVDEYGIRRAFVSIQPTAKDLELWKAMDKAADEVAKVLANGQTYTLLSKRRDGLGATHEEAGTLWMGESPALSVTDSFGRFHSVENAYVAGPALFPTIGSPNPVLTGLALARRLADRLIPQAPEAPQEPGFKYLFNGSDQMFHLWRTVGSGSFARVNRALVAQPGNDMGLFYYTKPIDGDFTLRLQFQLDRVDDNSGVFLRLLDPTRQVPDRSDPNRPRWMYDNPAYVAVDTGFEVQIDEQARGDERQGQPDGLDEHRTGAIYNIPIGTGAGEQVYRRGPILQAGQWNDLEIEVIGQTYTVRLNGQQTTRFTNPDAIRGRPSDPNKNIFSGYLGLQTRTGRVAFANLRYCVGKAAAPAAPAPPPAGIKATTATLEFLTDWHEQQTGYIVQGGRLIVQYDPARMPSKDPRRRCLAYVRFHPSRDLYSATMVENRMELTVPMDAAQAELWFQSMDSSGAIQWDSRLRQNYWYPVLTAVPAVAWPAVDYRQGAIPSREEVSVFDEAVLKQPLKAPKGRTAVQTQLSLKAKVRGEPFTKFVWADVHVFDRADRLINRKTVPLQYEQPAPGQGEIFTFQGPVDPEAVSAAQASTELPESTKVQYRLYYEVNNTVYTDGELHQVEAPEPTKA